MTCPSKISNQTDTSNLGGPFQGFSATQTVLNYKDGEQTAIRSVLRNGWTQYIFFLPCGRQISTHRGACIN